LTIENHRPLFRNRSACSDQRPEKNRTLACSEIKEVKQIKTMFGGCSSWVQIKTTDGTHNFTAPDSKDGTAIQQAMANACGVR